MKHFSSMDEAFKWWITEIYPALPPSQKTGHLKNAWRDYTYNLGISEKRMKQILSEFGKIDVKTIITFTPE